MKLHARAAAVAAHAISLFTAVLSLQLPTPPATPLNPAGSFQVIGNRVYDSSGNAVVFKGIGMTCTEYMTRPNMPFDAEVRGNTFRVLDGRIVEDWPGSFAWEACFCGAPAPNATLAVNNETSNMMAYLLADTFGGSFVTAPNVMKVPLEAPYSQVVNTSAPRSHPVIRVPITASSYLYTCDDNHLGADGYRALIDLLVQYFTSRGVAVIIDLHKNCAGGSKLNCVRDGPMALRNYGNVTGAGAFWSLVAATYASNPLVLYELYNEPHVWYQAFYGGDPLYIGMSELYAVVRNYTATGLIIIGGHDQYSQDAAGSVALWMQFMRESGGAAPQNILFNLHPYQGAYQGLEHSLRSTLRLTLALQTMAPVIWTELGQYCCAESGGQSCQTPAMCIDHTHGDWFVYNLLNMAAQFDVSWVGWAWRGSNANGGNCSQGEAICNSPDMRGVGGTLTNGSAGGADWAGIWATFAASDVVIVEDNGDPARINVSDYEVRGFLPRPCIVPNFGLGAACGFPLGTNISALPWNSMWNQTVFESVLPGLPPAGPASDNSTCFDQTCPGFPPCSLTSSVVPMPQPCGGG